MAALDFPDSPTVGQVYDRWTWNGTVWKLSVPAVRAGIVSLTTSSTGGVVVNFVPPMPAAPAILATANVYNLQVFAVAQPTVNAASMQVLRISDGSSVNNFAVTFSYIAAVSS